MAAGLGFKTFVTGDVLTAGDTNGYLMQGVWVFANATARDAAVTSPQEGNMCYLKDTNAVQSYSGTAWEVVGGGTTIYRVRKAGDQSVTSNTTVANDADLSFAVAANETFIFQCYVLSYSASSAGGFKATFAGPSGSTITGGPSNVILNASAASTAGSWGAGGATFDYFADSNNRPLYFSGTILNGATAGTCRLQWAQNTSTATAVTVKAGSYIFGMKV